MFLKYATCYILFVPKGGVFAWGNLFHPTHNWSNSLPFEGPLNKTIAILIYSNFVLWNISGIFRHWSINRLLKERKKYHSLSHYYSWSGWFQTSVSSSAVSYRTSVWKDSYPIASMDYDAGGWVVSWAIQEVRNAPIAAVLPPLESEKLL